MEATNLVIQPSLTGGELGPNLWGRVDMARYADSLKACRNFIVKPFGGVVNRPGFEYIATTKTSAKASRLVPFCFNESQTYVMEFGEGYLRFFQNGGEVVATSIAAWVTATSYGVGDIHSHGGVNYYCTTAHASGTFATDVAAGYWYAMTGTLVEIPSPYLASELSSLKWAQCADLLVIVHPNHPPMGLKRYSNQKWTLTELALNTGPFQDVNADKSIAVSCSANIGDITLAATNSLFTSAHVGQLFYLEQRDFGIAWLPNVAITAGDIRRADGKYYKALNSGTTGQNIPTGTLERWHDGGVDWAYLHSGFGICRITAVTNGTTASARVLSYMPTGATGVSYGSPLAISSISQNADGSTLLYIPNHGLTIGSYGYGTWQQSGNTAEFLMLMIECGEPIISVPDGNHISTNAGFIWVSNAISRGTLYIVPPSTPNVGNSSAWAFGSFGDPSIGGPGYPSAVCFHQQRLVFGGTQNQPNSFWMSRTGDYTDFGISSPMVADDTITFTLASMKMDQIQSFLPLQQLVVFTNGGQWAVAGSSSEAMDATAPPVAKLQGFHGSSSLQSLPLGNSCLFMQSKAQNIRDLAYDWAANSYAATDLTIMAPHLFEGYQITEWAYHQAPYSCAWCVRNDGTLLGLTYFKEQQVAGWHRHDTDGSFESVCVVSEVAEDSLYAIVNRTVTGSTKRYIERMASRVVTDVRDGFFVDSGLSVDGRNTGSITMTFSGGTNWDETETLTVTASSASFVYPGTSDVGDQIQFEDDDAGITYRATILSTSSTTTATVRLDRQIPAGYRNTARTDWAWARNTFTGLNHLEGKTVSILGDGSVQPQQVVTNGTITLYPPAARVVAGLPIQADLETLDLSIPGIETILPKNKCLPMVRILVNETQTLKAGRAFTNLFENKARSTENYDQPINLQTGIVTIHMDSSWDTSGSVCIRHELPTPVGILAIIPTLALGGVA